MTDAFQMLGGSTRTIDFTSHSPVILLSARFPIIGMTTISSVKVYLRFVVLRCDGQLGCGSIQEECALLSDAAMFRPIPETTLFRRIPYRLIASVLLLLALVVSVLLLVSLERESSCCKGSLRTRRLRRNCSTLSGNPATS